MYIEFSTVSHLALINNLFIIIIIIFFVIVVPFNIDIADYWNRQS